jgi:hypothetical protein
MIEMKISCKMLSSECTYLVVQFYVVRNGGKIMAGRNEAGNGGKKKTRDQARYKHDNDE